MMIKKNNILDPKYLELNSFSRRHIGVPKDVSIEMLKEMGFASMDSFIQSIVPKNIFNDEGLNIDDEASEEEALRSVSYTHLTLPTMVQV